MPAGRGKGPLPERASRGSALRGAGPPEEGPPAVARRARRCIAATPSWPRRSQNRFLELQDENVLLRQQLIALVEARALHQGAPARVQSLGVHAWDTNWQLDR